MKEIESRLSQTEATLAAHAARLQAIEDWQRRQNGTLERVEGKIDTFKDAIFEKFETLADRAEKRMKWTISLLFGFATVVAAIVALIN